MLLLKRLDEKMVKKIEKHGKILFQCEECQFIYDKEEFAKECEAFCKKYKSCNLDLIKYAIKFE